MFSVFSHLRNAIRTTLRFHLAPVRRLSPRKQATTDAGEDVVGKEPSYTAGGKVNYCSHHGNQYGGSSKF
jgi:hypothetical protein